MEQQVYTDEQVERTVNGVLEYAYRIEAELDPVPENLLWLNEGDAIPAGFVAYTMRTSTKGTRSMVGSQWGTCYICRSDFPTSEMVLKSGKYFCIKNKCADDI